MKKIFTSLVLAVFAVLVPFSILAVTPEGGGDPTAGSGNFATGEGVGVEPTQNEVSAQEVPNEENSENSDSRSNESNTTPAGIFVGVSSDCFNSGVCTACDVLIVFINIANLILGSLAIIATIFFVYGAGQLMLSAGNEQRVEKGKNIIKATVIGTVIVLFAWQAMSIIVWVITQDSFELFDTRQQTSTHDGSSNYNPLYSWYDVKNSCQSKVK